MSVRTLLGVAALVTLAAVAGAGALALAGAEKAAPQAAPGVPVTGGAAPGYVPDQACGTCHADLFRSYREVAMARSFYAPDNGPTIEDFAALPFFHQPSNQYFEPVARRPAAQQRDQAAPLHVRRWRRTGGIEEGRREVEVESHRLDA